MDSPKTDSYAPSPAEKYLHGKFKSLGAEAMAKTRIYLDTNFWSRLRKEETGQESNPMVASLLTALREQVAAGGLVCTYSAHTLSEIMKHADPGVRADTVALFDELSRGFCLANQERLFSNEIVHWLCGWMSPECERYPLSQLAWTRPSYLVVDCTPQPLPQLAPVQQQAIHEEFIDYLWDMPMTKVLASIALMDAPYPSLDWPVASAELINSELRDFDHENDTAEQTYVSELWGLVDWAGPILTERYIEAATRWGKPAPSNGEETLACMKMLQRLIMRLSEARLIAQELPSIHIRTTLHAQIRWDKGRRFKPNDLMDIEHTETALPYCNFFFTDAPNAHLIRASKLDLTYGCKVTGSVPEALELVRTIS